MGKPSAWQLGRCSGPAMRRTVTTDCGGAPWTGGNPGSLGHSPSWLPPLVYTRSIIIYKEFLGDELMASPRWRPCPHGPIQSSCPGAHALAKAGQKQQQEARSLLRGREVGWSPTKGVVPMLAGGSQVGQAAGKANRPL